MKGIAEVIVYCVNDGAVMKAWAKDQGVEGSLITFMADTQGTLTEALGVNMEHPGPLSVLGSPRCQRHALYVEDGVIKAFEVAATEDDPAGDDNPEATLVENMLSKVPDLSEDERKAVEAPLKELEEQAVASVTEKIESDDLVLFAKPGCPFCEDAMETLSKNGFSFSVVYPSAKRGLEKLTGATSYPFVFAKGSYIGGCNDGKEPGQGVKPMIKSGKLQEILQE